VLKKEADGYVLYEAYTGKGTAAVYDVLKFGIDKTLAAEFEERGQGAKSLGKLTEVESDDVFGSVREGGQSGVKEEVSETLGVAEDNVILLDYGTYRLNDLISVRKQTEEIMEKIK